MSVQGVNKREWKIDRKIVDAIERLKSVNRWLIEVWLIIRFERNFLVVRSRASQGNGSRACRIVDVRSCEKEQRHITIPRLCADSLAYFAAHVREWGCIAKTQMEMRYEIATRTHVRPQFLSMLMKSKRGLNPRVCRSDDAQPVFINRYSKIEEIQTAHLTVLSN